MCVPGAFATSEEVEYNFWFEVWEGDNPHLPTERERLEKTSSILFQDSKAE